MQWDPKQYGRYADERGRPFVDLLTRVGAESPRRVVDLGCGPGTMTALLASRWPDAIVEGIDSSASMIESASPLVGDRLRFAVDDVTTWSMPPDADVVISNATLQWVPGHDRLLGRWAAALPSGGWLAFQVPGNFESPSHVLMRSLASSPAWSSRLQGVLRHGDAVSTPGSYLSLLQDCGLDVDVWETTYSHVLPGADPVLEWLRGTGLRPVLAALSPAEGAEFSDSFAALLRGAYPRGPHGTVFPFRRFFAVAHKP